MTANEGRPPIRRISELDDEDLPKWLALGLLCTLADGDDLYVSARQHARLQLLSKALPPVSQFSHPTSLFAPETIVALDDVTTVSSSPRSPIEEEAATSVFAQLLPKWSETLSRGPGHSKAEPSDYMSLGNLDLVGSSPALLDQIRTAQTRVENLAGSHVSQFSRSAHYMGSKVSLAPFLNEILHAYLPPESAVVDLMCGSGAAAGAFSRYWSTVASDAQSFSQRLAVVQGGGMTHERARETAQEVLVRARSHYESLPDFVHTEIKKEQGFLAAELTPDTLQSLSTWIAGYPRAGDGAVSGNPFDSLLTFRRESPSLAPYLLFTAYYGNLFIGVRQAAEIDSLRYSIDQLENETDRAWALGALICAVSSCAFTYGGHFAQPKLDPKNPSKLGEHANEMLVQRGLSVSHEFFVRLTNLGAESSKAANAIEAIEGPWEIALQEAAIRLLGRPVCVYFDPPYTRDEYSRYYHVLETLVRYQYPLVSGKASIPKPGDAGRFMSPFCTRSVDQVESLLARVIDQCLSLGWSCLWSYSNTGVASISQVIGRLQSPAPGVELFAMDHVYKAQGRHKAKAVTEYAVLICPQKVTER
ncbi:hypothetical protein [Caenimonas soli]|uniref:hypothetical protein n=1 Tax=Caenimonas soli TaxID=2735555 RepID=UPI0015526BE6|nr:hypothetical protein [Caenimonas soli]NPC57831.1 hypothetical protein [Caenimonas soli]